MNARLISGLVLAGAVSFATAAVAQDYGNFTIGAGFLPDPQTGTGLTGGPVDASTYGPGCVGSIDTTPDHVITVTSTVNLKLYVDSDTDATLVLRGPAGTFCDDDSHGNLDPELNVTLTPGEYHVWVGNFGSTQGRYTLTLTENMGGAAAPQVGNTGGGGGGGSARYESFTLGAGFLPDPQYGNGQTGGSASASAYGPGCVGNISSSPDHVINVTSTVNLRVFTESEVDSTLVITGPGGTFCDDDSNGNLDAQINAVFTPGTYNVFVGNFGSTSGAYRLTITENL
jgi:hypothetical protein